VNPRKPMWLNIVSWCGKGIVYLLMSSWWLEDEWTWAMTTVDWALRNHTIVKCTIIENSTGKKITSQQKIAKEY
jgi:hypothetical protein